LTKPLHCVCAKENEGKRKTVKRKGNSMVIVIKKKKFLKKEKERLFGKGTRPRVATKAPDPLWREGQKEVAAGSPNLLSHGCILEDKGKKRRKEI